MTFRYRIIISIRGAPPNRKLNQTSSAGRPYAHTDHPPQEVTDDLTAFRVEAPEEMLVERVEAEDTPSGWDRGADHPECQRIGELWVGRESSPVLEVPSAVLPREMNYLVNPRHPEADSIQVVGQESFRFDKRLVRLREE